MSWNLQQWKSVLEIKSGRSHKQVKNPNGKYSIYGSGGIMGYADNFICNEGTTIIGRKGTINSPIYVEKKFWNVDTAFGLSPSENIESKFLYYFCLGYDFTKHDKGTTLPSLVKKDLLVNVFMPVPSLEEQKRIVEILDEAFEGIDRAEANTKKNLANTQELFDSYLNKVFTEKGDGWVERNLKDIAIEFGRGKSKHRPRNDKKLYGGKYPFIQTGDIRNSNHIVKKYSQTYNETGLAQSKLWRKGTVCITIAANIAETAVLDFDACIPDSIIGIYVDENRANNIFVEYMLQSFKLFLQAKGKGSAQDNINMGTFRNQTFPFPDVNTQKIIADNLDDLSKKVYKLEKIYQRKLKALAELKQSILQKAFTGKLT